MTAIATPLRTGAELARRPVPALALLRRHRFAAAVLGAQALLMALVEAHHKPWFDEAQAWLLARDTSPLNLFVHHLRYEGTPGLWHLLLMVPAKLGLPYRSMAVIAIGATLVGSAILLLRSPFPRLISVLICFSFFPFFQYGVVARSYCLLAPLLFLLASSWRSRLEHPARTFLLLSLLANVSLHGFLMAIALGVLHLNDVRRCRTQLGHELRRRQLRWSGGFGLVLASVVLELLPPRDLIGGGSTWHFNAPWELLGSHLFLQQLPIIVPTLAVLALSLWWLRQRRCLLLFALPAGALLLLFTFRYISPWHIGTIFLCWVFALWLSLDGVSQARPVSQRVRRGFLAAATALLAGQVAWTGMSIAYDWSNSYSASADAAAYIRDHHLDGSRIDLIGKWGVGILPYFSSDIFHDYNDGHGPSFFPWTTRSPLPSRKSEVLLDQPEVIVVGVKSKTGQSQLACLPGYRREQAFSGGIYWPGGVMETESFAIYRRDSVGGDAWYWGTCGLL